VNTALHTVDPASCVSTETFKGLFDALPVAVHEIDASGLLVRVNEAECNLLGYRAAEMLGRPVWQFVIPEQREVSRESVLLKLAGHKPLVPFEREYAHRDGGILTFQVHEQHVRNAAGDPVGIRSVLLDMTERKRHATELAEKAAELARSNADLEQFAYVASHDLQEPLRMVASYTQLLERRYKDKLDEDANDYIKFAVQGAKRMQQLIEDLLAYSRVGRRGQDRLLTDSEAALRAAMSAMQTMIADRRATITHEALPPVLADGWQITQVFQNLLVNAIKYCKTLPHVHVSASRHAREWRFAVADNAIGIDPQYSDRVFQVFQRLHTREEYAGTGIGLAICKKVVERHGGRIWFEPNPGGGTIFYFTIADPEQRA
jgi:PAS domain S-box-containing protein